MTLLDQRAAELLEAAAGAGVDVARSFVAPGPSFALDCRLIAVHLTSLDLVRPSAQFAGMCWAVPQAIYTVTFVADCVPVSDDDGDPPAADAITAWSLAFLADAEKIHDAVVAACTNLADCEGASVGSAVPRGPGGGVAVISWPVTFTFTET